MNLKIKFHSILFSILVIIISNHFYNCQGSSLFDKITDSSPTSNQANDVKII
jgi:hypothetical protein